MTDMSKFPQIPGYQLHALLGQGGMSKVYLGVQEKLDREVAIKVLTPEMFVDEQYLQRFIMEARTASQLSHPNIVTIHDVGQAGEICYIIMERLQESLTERVKFRPDGRLAPQESFRIIRLMAGALDYAHRAGVIHRDIKPDNILFRRDGTPVLVDFGIARALHSQANLTTTGMIIGTPHYMSPEQCKGEPIDHQSDIYSLGIVLYEILTGKAPYMADSTAGVLLKHVQNPAPVLPPELSRFQPLIARMLSKNKRERVHSGEELMRLIDHFSPDVRIDPGRGYVDEQWYFQAPGNERPTPPPPPPLDESMILTIKTPSQTSIPPVQHKSRALLIVSLVSAPLILIAAYFALFYNHSGSATTPKASQNPAPLSNDPSGSRPAESVTKEITPPPGPGQAGTLPNDPQENVRRLLIVADDFIANDELERARAKLEEARKISNSPEVNALELKIKEKEALRKENEYLKYITLARDALDGKNYEKAKINLQRASEIKPSDRIREMELELAEAERRKMLELDKAKREALLAKQLMARDDEAFKRAESEHTVYAFEKYLKLFPKGAHALLARKKYDELKSSIQLEERIKDDTAFEMAKKANTIDALQEYQKNFRAGLHKVEAETLVNLLKEKTLKNIEIRVALQQVRFFEGDAKAPPVEQRKYSAVFDRGQLRYVYTEILYVNNLYRIASFSSAVRIVYTHAGGAMSQELKGAIALEIPDRDGMYWRGMGWPEPGKWPAGSYAVVIYIDGKAAGEANFTVK